MKITFSGHTTREQAKRLNQMLKAAGYRSTAERCYDYLINIADKFCGNDPDVKREVRAMVESL